MTSRVGLPRLLRGRLFGLAFCCFWIPGAHAAPQVPGNDDAVLAELSAGTRYGDVAARRLSRGRVDVAIPLAQFYIEQSRATGDLRFLGYAEAVLAPWVARSTPNPDVLVLQATLLQSRHEFSASLAALDRSLAIRP